MWKLTLGYGYYIVNAFFFFGFFWRKFWRLYFCMVKYLSFHNNSFFLQCDDDSHSHSLSHSDNIMSNEYINYELLTFFNIPGLSNCNTLLPLPFNFLAVRKMIMSQWNLPKSTEIHPHNPSLGFIQIAVCRCHYSHCWGDLHFQNFNFIIIVTQERGDVISYYYCLGSNLLLSCECMYEWMNECMYVCMWMENW